MFILFYFLFQKNYICVTVHQRLVEKFFYLKKILKKSKVIKHGIETNDYKKINIQNIFNVGFVGRIEGKKIQYFFLNSNTFFIKK